MKAFYEKIGMESPMLKFCVDSIFEFKFSGGTSLGHQNLF